MVSGASRRVLLGWLQNGGSSNGNFGHDSAENTLTLPRDLSLAKDGSMRQAYIPELQKLRSAEPLYYAKNVVFPPPSGSPPGSYAGAKVLLAKGLQLEISARIRWDAADRRSVFGLLVLNGEGERTALGFDLARGQVFIDRRQSSANRTDADVRAGPMPRALSEPNVVHLHAYVDHSIVTLIAENQTALTVYVHPISASSTGVALFNSHSAADSDVDGAGAGGEEAGLVVAEQISIWSVKSVVSSERLGTL